MGATDGSTAADRATVVGQLLSRQGEYGVVTGLSRAVGVAWQTLYIWPERGRAALERAFAPPVVVQPVDAALGRAVLTLLVEGHAGERGIQRCLAARGRAVSLGTISAVVTEAERRALRVNVRRVAVGPWIVAIDEVSAPKTARAPGPAWHLTARGRRTAAMWTTTRHTSPRRGVDRYQARAPAGPGDPMAPLGETPCSSSPRR